MSSGNVAYDRFLSRSLSSQSFGALTAPVVIFWSKDVLLGIGCLTLSFLVAAALAIDKASWAGFTAFGHLRLASWWREALGIGTATILIALAYGVDVVALRMFLNAEDVAAYRLALLAVGFVVAIAPLNIFVLSDVSSGLSIRLRMIAAVGSCYAIVAASAGFLLTVFTSEFQIAGYCLMILSPLAFVRLVSQVLVSALNACRVERRVVTAYSFCLSAWLALFALGAVDPLSLSAIALFQVVNELLVAGLLFLFLRRFASRTLPRHYPGDPPLPEGS